MSGRGRGTMQLEESWDQWLKSLQSRVNVPRLCPVGGCWPLGLIGLLLIIKKANSLI